jgi:hypothetical protein
MIVYKFLFYQQKKFRNKLISHHNMQPNTLTRREYKDKIYVKNITKKSCRIRNQLKSMIRIRKKSFQIHDTEVNLTTEVFGIPE